ncbi:efflux RND transporter periplasmic adaptor subunit [Rubrivirga litoralis]|uniref:Efflux RND transporter periplasmic adaptor subunit n=1 Tax=Rubrivirga litoralis TaxID=3075598 RepID=A0ABU3BRL8_9BACT|nr:efflux RND transporter periplasmic adaptor subunit [Rubrivirga sp. F394]MDT0631931.1 efflux RND transporter periplasmic adaptor subunit [Rubrivirga sp. F394]
MMHPDFAPRPRKRAGHPFPSAVPRLLGIALAVLGLLLGAVALAGCGGEPEAAQDFEILQPDAALVEVVAVSGTTFEDVIELTGTVDAGEDAQLSPSASGVLTYVAPVGARVGRGGVVARVDAGTQRAGVAQARAQASQSRAGINQAQAQVAQARAGIEAGQAQRRAATAQLRLAQQQVERQRPLLQQQIISPLEFEQVEGQLASAQAQVAQADAQIAQARGQLAAAQEGVQAARAGAEAGQAGVQSAQAQLSNTTVRAPFGGVVEAQLAEPGELASPGQAVVRLVGGGGLRVEAGVPERYSGEIEVGTQVTVRPTAYSAEPRGGRVVFVGTAVDAGSRTFPIEVAVDNADGALRSEMVVELTVTRALIQDALVLPQDAVVRDERGTSVFVAVPADTADVFVAERRAVRLGASSGGEVVVAEGLRVGDRVVVSGQSSLADGDALQVEARVARRRAPAAPDAPAGLVADATAAVEPQR